MKNIEKFIEKLGRIYNEEDLEICKKGFEIEKRKTCFRINNLKTNENEIIKILEKNNLKSKKINFLKNGYILENGKEKNLWDLDIFSEGKIYLQSLSSQIPVDILDLKSGDNILDITSAPGGKTSQIQSILKNNGRIVAVDNNQIRIDKLKFTLERQGVKNVKILKTDARSLFEENKDFENYFDKIIADLPCSAEGKINFNKEKSFGYWKEEVINKNSKLQKSILKNIIPMLKTGGEIIYSTCTISPEENEDIIHFLLCNFPELKLEKINIDYKFARKGLKIFGNKHFKKEISENVIRILPTDECEGFFIAKLRKD